MECGDIHILKEGLNIKVEGGKVNVGPEISIPDGNVSNIIDIRNLICCHCTKSVGVKNIILAHLRSRPINPNVVCLLVHLLVQ